MFTRYQCRCAAAGGQRPRAGGLHHPQHDRLRHGRPHRRTVRVVQCALQKFYSKENMIGGYANINILDRKISATLLTLTVDVICTIMFMQKPFGLSKNMLWSVQLYIICRDACSSMQCSGWHHTMTLVSCSLQSPHPLLQRQLMGCRAKWLKVSCKKPFNLYSNFTLNRTLRLLNNVSCKWDVI